MNYLTDELIKPNSNYNFINQIGILPAPEKVLSRSRNPYNTLRELKNDPHIWSCIQSRKSGTLTLDNFVDANYANNEIFNFVKQLLENLDLNKIISEILDAPFLGFQIHEIIWDYNDNKQIIPIELKSKLQEFFISDSKGELKYKSNFSDDLLKLPEYKFIISSFERCEAMPYGNSLLSKCYWNVIFKNSATRFWVNYMEKYGMPLLIGQYQRGSTQEENQKLADVLSNMTDDTVIVTPMDINIDIKEATRNSSTELFRELINQCNSEISKTLLSQTLTTEIGAGTFAAAQTHFRVRKEVIIADSKIVENSINKLIEYAVKINFHSSQIPKFRFVINDSDNLNKIDRDIKLVNSGVKFTKEYIMKTYGLRSEDFDL